MLDDKRFLGICEIVNRNGEVLTQELKVLGVNQRIINECLLMGYLVRIKRGHYIVKPEILSNYLEKRNQSVKKEKKIEIPAGEIKLTTVYSSLLNGQVERAKKELKIYLENIGKTEYLNFALLLIDCDLLVGDPAFYGFIIPLANIDVNEFEFDRSVYEEARDEALSRNEKRRAWFYQAILDDAEARENTKKLTLNK